MPDVPPGSPIKFPVKAAGPALILPRRRLTATHSPLEISAASAEARKQIDEIVSVTRTPWADAKQPVPALVETLERSLRELEAKLAEREASLTEMEARMADRERDLAEAEALIAARAKLLEVARKNAPVKGELSKEEQAAIEQLKAELDRQELSLKEQKVSVAEREQFLEENETKLFEKMMQQQEKETELEQREEDLSAREKRVRAREAGVDPQMAAQLKAEADAPKKFDEFNE